MSSEIDSEQVLIKKNRSSERTNERGGNWEGEREDWYDVMEHENKKNEIYTIRFGYSFIDLHEQCALEGAKESRAIVWIMNLTCLPTELLTRTFSSGSKVANLIESHKQNDDHINMTMSQALSSKLYLIK